MKQYIDLVNTVFDTGTRRENRTGVDTISKFNYNYEVDLANGFPLLTTKSMSWKNILIENLWFLSGQSNIDFLHHYGVKFWDAWADNRGFVPSAYGNFWRHFPVPFMRPKECEHDLEPDYCDACQMIAERSKQNDQVAWVIEELKRNPHTRRAVISAWAPGNAQSSKLPPCHVMFVLNVQQTIATQRKCAFFVNHGDSKYHCANDAMDTYCILHGGRPLVTKTRLNLHLTQRSADVALGVPYNLAGYAFLLSLFSRFTGMEPGVFAHSLVDAHIYTSKPDGSMAEYDHMPGLKIQANRKPNALPDLIIDKSIQTLDDIDRIVNERPPIETLMELFKIDGYSRAWPAINFKVAV